MRDCRQPWQVYALTMAPKECGTTLKPLLPICDPVAKKRIATHKRDNLLISGVEGEVSAFNMTKKQSIGKAGVHICFYKKPEYDKLSDEQKVELKEWRENNPDAVIRGKQQKFKGKEDKKRLYSNKEMASLLSKKVKLAVGQKDRAGKEEEETSAYIRRLNRPQPMLHRQLQLLHRPSCVVSSSKPRTLSRPDWPRRLLILLRGEMVSFLQETKSCSRIETISGSLGVAKLSRTATCIH
jgi:hypothetical protein